MRALKVFPSKLIKSIFYVLFSGNYWQKCSIVTRGNPRKRETQDPKTRGIKSRVRERGSQDTGEGEVQDGRCTPEIKDKV